MFETSAERVRLIVTAYNAGVHDAEDADEAELMAEYERGFDSGYEEGLALGRRAHAA